MEPIQEEKLVEDHEIHGEGHSRLLKISLASLGIIGLLVFGVYLGMNLRRPTLEGVQTTQTGALQPTYASSNLQESKTDMYSGWVTYTNSEQGYSIQYPKTMFVRLNCPGEQLLLLKRGPADTKDVIDMPTCGRDGRYPIEIFAIDRSLEVPQSNENYSVRSEEVTVGGISATKYIVTLIKPLEGPGLDSYIYIVATAEGKTYNFHLGSKELEPVFNQMLSTFKFLEIAHEGTEQQAVSGQPQSSEIVVTSPQPFGTHSVSQPLTITGEAPSSWYFEGEIPVKILDPDGGVIVTSFVSEVTPGTWMSGGMVPFSGQVQFTTNAASGFLVIEKNNPSDLPENAASIEIPLNFDR